jgi:hypothetical protein
MVYVHGWERGTKSVWGWGMIPIETQSVTLFIYGDYQPTMIGILFLIAMEGLKY